MSSEIILFVFFCINIFIKTLITSLINFKNFDTVFIFILFLFCVTVLFCVQAQPIPPELAAKLLGNRVAVSPIVTVEPRRYIEFETNNHFSQEKGWGGGGGN